MIGNQPISVAAMAKMGPFGPTAPPAWGARFTPVFLFPK